LCHQQQELSALNEAVYDHTAKGAVIIYGRGVAPKRNVFFLEKYLLILPLRSQKNFYSKINTHPWPKASDLIKLRGLEI
jgi:hypothetical protein